MLRLLLLVTTFVVHLCPRADAQILLKPTGGNALPLRTKALDADVTLDRQFATTKLTLLFQNETSDRIEADFIYTLPKDTLVTYFAYWFGEEKVVARVVEKERAAAIYQYITSRMRDPALIELIGKDTFRARIFPVMPNADLKVEMVLVQALPCTPQGALYTLPLRVETKTDSLESVKVGVRVRRGGGVAKVENNYGLPVEEDSDEFRLALTGTNFRPSKDLRVTLTRPPRPLQAALFAAPSSPGGDGFFALALTPDGTVERPVVRISGVKTYDVVADRPPVLRPHQALIVVGRYKGNGPATVTLADGTGRAKRIAGVQFESEVEPNSVATKLWAARRIALLSTSKANEEAVVALSKRFTLPSKFTSWLAVPKAEMERYAREKDEAELDVAARQIARLITNGEGGSRRMRALRARFATLCRRLGRDPANELRWRLSDATQRELRAMGDRLAAEVASGRGNSASARRLRARLAALCRRTEQDPRAILRESLAGTISDRANRLAEAIARGEENTPAARRLRRELVVVSRAVGDDPDQRLAEHIALRLRDLARRHAEGKHGESLYLGWDGPEQTVKSSSSAPDKLSDVQLAAIRRQMEPLARAARTTVEAALDEAFQIWKLRDLLETRKQILAERRKETPDAGTLRALEARFVELTRGVTEAALGGKQARP
jgi:hypothetical protein